MCRIPVKEAYAGCKPCSWPEESSLLEGWLRLDSLLATCAGPISFLSRRKIRQSNLARMHKYRLVSTYAAASATQPAVSAPQPNWGPPAR